MSTMTMDPLVPVPTETLGISVPQELRQQIMTAVPMKVVVQLLNPEYRSSVANDFAEGNTPSWYQKLDPSLKTYFEGMAGSIRTGDAVFTVTQTPTPTPGGDENVESTSSDGLAQPTGASGGIVAGAVGMAGVLGVALAL